MANDPDEFDDGPWIFGPLAGVTKKVAAKKAVAGKVRSPKGLVALSAGESRKLDSLIKAAYRSKASATKQRLVGRTKVKAATFVVLKIRKDASGGYSILVESKKDAKVSKSVKKIAKKAPTKKTPESISKRSL